jgi:hypothetical protein
LFPWLGASTLPASRSPASEPTAWRRSTPQFRARGRLRSPRSRRAQSPGACRRRLPCPRSPFLPSSFFLLRVGAQVTSVFFAADQTTRRSAGRCRGVDPLWRERAWPDPVVASPHHALPAARLRVAPMRVPPLSAVVGDDGERSRRRRLDSSVCGRACCGARWISASARVERAVAIALRRVDLNLPILVCTRERGCAWGHGKWPQWLRGRGIR